MPIYQIATAGEEAKRLVKAASSAAAIAHCAKGKFSASLVTKVEDVADILSEGVRIETAGAVEAASEPTPEKVEESTPPKGKDKPAGDE